MMGIPQALISSFSGVGGIQPNLTFSGRVEPTVKVASDILIDVFVSGLIGDLFDC